MEAPRKSLLVIGMTLESAKAQMEHLGKTDYETWDRYNHRMLEEWGLNVPTEHGHSFINDQRMVAVKRHSSQLKHNHMSRTLPDMVVTIKDSSWLARMFEMEPTEGVPLPTIADYLYDEVWVESDGVWRDFRAH